MSEDQNRRKANSERLLESLSIKINSRLPVIESEAETVIRSALEIAQRVTILTVITMVAFGNIEAEEAVEFIEGFGMWDLVTPDERDFLMAPTEEKNNQETWKCEGIFVLLWALNIVPELDFPNHPASLDAIGPERYPIGNSKDPTDFIIAARETRTKSEILDAADLYYRMDWACVDAGPNNEELQMMHPGIVYERHYALNWLINYSEQEWDDISCDT